MMKVVIVDTTIAGDLIGGAQTFLPNLMRGLSERGVEVHLVTNGRPHPKILSYVENSGCLLHANLLSSNLFVEDQRPILADWINKISPDIYLISVSPDIGWAVLPLLNPQIATIAIAHSNQQTFYKPINHYSNYLNKAIGVSQEICNKFVSECGLVETKVYFIPYGVETLNILQKENINKPIQLIYVGRLEDVDKRSSDIIEIIKRLEKRNFGYKFRIIGDGSLKPKFAVELESEIKSGSVELLGWLESEQVLFHLRQSDVFILTSESEGFCIAMIEAAGNGCSLLVTDIPGGNQQLVKNSKNGFLIPVGKVENFAEQIQLLSENRELLFALRKNAFDSGRVFSIQKMVESYYECFLQSIADTKENPREPNPHFPLMESCRSKYPLWLRRIKAKTKQYISVG